MNTLRVLLVEDDAEESNRITEYLEQANHAVMATHGLTEASQALEMQRFDAVMLTSRLISQELRAFRENLTRLGESGKASARIPVVCYGSSASGHLSPAAMQEFEIDACLPGPFDVNALSGLVRNWASASAAAASGADASNSERVLPVFKSEELQEQVGFDTELIAELLNLFLADSDEQLEAMKQALAAGDLRTLSRVAHSIKGSLGSLYALQSAARAETLEQAAKSENAETSRAALSGLEKALAILKPELLKLLGTASVS